MRDRLSRCGIQRIEFVHADIQDGYFAVTGPAGSGKTMAVKIAFDYLHTIMPHCPFVKVSVQKATTLAHFCKMLHEVMVPPSMTWLS